MFKKPKRNFRPRETGDTEDADDDKTAELVTAVKNKKDKKLKDKKNSGPTSQPVLSFDLDLNEGDDGEIFQVKKSSQSKKMRKLMDKEKKKKKEPKDNPVSAPSNGSNKTTITTEDDIVITVKNTLPGVVLNGREAEAAAVEGMSSDEEETLGRHKFSTASRDVKTLLQRGKIPDAATIHAARKQRQHVREMADFIPIHDDNSRDNENGDSRGGRLEEDEGSDEEDKMIKMTVDTAKEDRLRLRAEFNAAQQQQESDQSDKGEEDEWEQQQIRKGVTGAQIAAVQQESMYYQQYMMGCPPPPVISLEAPAPPSIGKAFVQTSTRSADPLTANSVLSRLTNRLGELREVERKHRFELENGRTEMRLIVEEADTLRNSLPELERKFVFYQELRGYVTDLVECLDEKILVVEMLEERVLTWYSRRAQDTVARRRQDVQDQAYQLPSNPIKGAAVRDDAMRNRIAEREGRRIRRQKQREMRNLQHIDGMSSDDELTEVQQISHNTSRDIIERDAKLVFEDVHEEFCTLNGILRRFETWRDRDMHTYSEAYVSLCLPKVLGPIIRLNTLFWNPLIHGGGDIEKSGWFKALLLYGAKPGETEAVLGKDPDVQLLPRIIDRVVLPRINQLIKEAWDPVSNSQTICLVSLITRLIQEYPTLTHNSKSVKNVIETVVSKIRTALDSDVFIPLYSKIRLADNQVRSFFMRQCVVCIKLLGNIARWQGLLSDSVLTELAIDSLLNRYLIMAIGSTSPLHAANIIHMIGSVLPRVWISSKLPKLNIFLNQIRAISLQLSRDKPLERDALERMSSIL